jgi:hypothetical protein
MASALSVKMAQNQILSTQHVWSVHLARLELGVSVTNVVQECNRRATAVSVLSAAPGTFQRLELHAWHVHIQ